MADYLDKLVNRNLNRTEGVRPRAPARFEPLTSNEDSLIAQPSAEPADSQPRPTDFTPAVPLPALLPNILPQPDPDSVSSPANATQTQRSPAPNVNIQPDLPTATQVPSFPEQGDADRSYVPVAEPGIKPLPPPDSSPYEQVTTSAESTPTIRVTIGRLEVRAVNPDPAPANRAKPAKPGPKLALSDYLQQRSGGRR